MGFLVNVDLETTSGPTSEFYIRIENWKINRASNLITFTTTAWLNKEYATNFNRKYADDNKRNAVGLVGSKVVYYEDELSKGEKVNIKNLYTFEMISEINPFSSIIKVVLIIPIYSLPINFFNCQTP